MAYLMAYLMYLSLRINGDTGNLEPLETCPVGQRLMWVVIIELPG